MAAANHNIIVSRGEDFSFDLTISDGVGTINLTDNVIKAEIRRGGGKPLVASFVATIPAQFLADGTTASEDKGKVALKLAKAESLKLDGNLNYKWDLFWATDTAPVTTTRLIHGDVKVENNITNI
mgnify:FL=1